MRSLLALGLFAVTAAQAGVLFSDNFNSGASALWGNELGGWSASGGVYDSASPNNTPPTYSLVNQIFTDFTLDVDINAARDGGIWLRSDANHDNALVLVTGGGYTGYTGLYFHRYTAGVLSGPFAAVGSLFTPGDNIHLTVESVGTSIALYLNGNFVESITETILTSGRIGLYDFSAQTFDNFVVTDGVPEPGTIGLMLGGAACAMFLRHRRRN